MTPLFWALKALIAAVTSPPVSLPMQTVTSPLAFSIAPTSMVFAPLVAPVDSEPLAVEPPSPPSSPPQAASPSVRTIAASTATQENRLLIFASPPQKNHPAPGHNPRREAPCCQAAPYPFRARLGLWGGTGSTHRTARAGRTSAMWRDARALASRTVSRVLNDSPLVSAATHRRVSAAIEELGYRRNLSAQKLSLGRSHAIGVVAPVLHLGLRRRAPSRGGGPARRARLRPRPLRRREPPAARRRLRRLRAPGPRRRRARHLAAAVRRGGRRAAARRAARGAHRRRPSRPAAHRDRRRAGRPDGGRAPAGEGPPPSGLRRRLPAQRVRLHLQRGPPQRLPRGGRRRPRGRGARAARPRRGEAAGARPAGRRRASRPPSSPRPTCRRSASSRPRSSSGCASRRTSR